MTSHPDYTTRPILKEKIEALEAQVRELQEALRREWWINHGHDYHALYGDDGEMQCAACPADFKRQPIAELRKIVRDARLERAAALVPANEETREQTDLRKQRSLESPLGPANKETDERPS
jgi:hypothetical protein